MNNRSEKSVRRSPELMANASRNPEYEVKASPSSGLGANETLYEQTGVAMTCRSFQEYCRMFMLEDELPKQGAAVLDVAAGASSFTAELCERGYRATACDPRYVLDPDAMLELGLQEHKQATEKLASKEHAFVWKDYGSLQAHDDMRHHSLTKFIDHYRQNYSSRLSGLESIDLNSSSYITAKLPELPFEDGQFELVLCNHFLFLYQEQFDYSFHLQAIAELYRVVKPEGRVLIYPLVGFRNEQYPHLSKLHQELTTMGAQVTLRATAFRFLPGADRFMELSKPV